VERKRSGLSVAPTLSPPRLALIRETGGFILASFPGKKPNITRDGDFEILTCTATALDFLFGLV
jgi:hypothetical protein